MLSFQIKFDQSALAQKGISEKEAVSKISKELLKYSIVPSKSQDNMFVAQTTNQVNCVLAFQKLSQTIPWLKACLQSADMTYEKHIVDKSNLLMIM